MVLRRPYGANCPLVTNFPTLKRGASNPCAYGAAEIGTSQVNKIYQVNKTSQVDNLNSS